MESFEYNHFGIINMVLFVGIFYYCYWDVELFDGYLVSSISAH